MFSATGHLLSGSIQRPDFITFSFWEEKVNESYMFTRSKICTLNKLGYKPGISTITGIGRALLGIIHTIVHLACFIFSKHKEHHSGEVKIGVKNIIRGLVEAVPVIGNLTMFYIDKFNKKKSEDLAFKQINNNPNAYRNHAVMFVDGKEIGKTPIEEVKHELSKQVFIGYDNVSLSDIIEIIRNHNVMIRNIDVV